MKKFLILLLSLILFQVNASFAETIEGGISFDWISKTQMERDENINFVRDEVFTNNLVTSYGKKFFRSLYSDKMKDADRINNYNEISNGKTEDIDKNYCGFYWKKYLIVYGIQYKNKPDENFYYNVMGNLKWIDKYSSNYPNFPYVSYQYDTSGNLKAVYYFNSSYDQYIFDENGKFQGRWYKDKMYDRKAKVIMTRTNWE